MNRYRAECSECPDRDFDEHPLQIGAEGDRDLHNFFAHEDQPVAAVKEVG